MLLQEIDQNLDQEQTRDQSDTVGLNRAQTFDDLSDYKQIKEDTKRAKKERRQQKLLERAIINTSSYKS